jgi:hypothetical protein
VSYRLLTEVTPRHGVVRARHKVVHFRWCLAQITAVIVLTVSGNYIRGDDDGTWLNMLDLTRRVKLSTSEKYIGFKTW